MLKVVAEHYVKEDCLEKFLELSKEIAEKTNALDEGCISYSMCRDINVPLLYSMIEEWESKETLDKHMQSAHFLEIVPQIRDCCSSQGGIHLYEKLY